MDLDVHSAESQFERWRTRAGLVLAPLAFGAVLFAIDLDEPGRRLSAVLASA